jgi:hypothetical protein
VLHAVRNLENENWVEDMEFEVENRSLRPIYYVSLTITFPDVPKALGPNGRLWGLATHAEYGRKDFAVNPGELATDDDLPIKPGERALIKLEALYSEGLKAFLKDHNFPEALIHRLIVRIEELRFGDGSGFRIGSVPYKWQKSRSSSLVFKKKRILARLAPVG